MIFNVECTRIIFDGEIKFLENVGLGASEPASGGHMTLWRWKSLGAKQRNNRLSADSRLPHSLAGLSWPVGCAKLQCVVTLANLVDTSTLHPYTPETSQTSCISGKPAAFRTKLPLYPGGHKTLGSPWMAAATDDSDGVGLTGDICRGGFTSCHHFLRTARAQARAAGAEGEVGAGCGRPIFHLP